MNAEGLPQWVVLMMTSRRARRLSLVMTIAMLLHLLSLDWMTWLMKWSEESSAGVAPGGGRPLQQGH